MTASYSRVTAHEDRSGFGPDAGIDPATDVMHSLGGELTRFVGPLDVSLKVVLTRDWNRYLEKNRDVSNANLASTVRHGL